VGGQEPFLGLVTRGVGGGSERGSSSVVVEIAAKERALITTALLLQLPLLLGEVSGKLRVEEVLVVVVVELDGEVDGLTELMSEPLRDRVGLRTEAYL
jgi:hypothetical protein